MTKELTRGERIAQARAELAKRHADDPAAVSRFQARMAALTLAKKREQERFEHLVLAKPRPKAPTGKRARKGKAPPVALSPGVEERVVLREDWSHKANGTPETWGHAQRTHQGALAQLHANGSIDDDQLAWAAEIGKASESIEHDVDVRTASLEARVDTSPGRSDLVEQRLSVVRLHVAYTRWRDMLPHPKRLVLDMLVGDPIGFSVAAARHRVHKRKAKRELIAALDRWPECKAFARAQIDQDGLDAACENLSRVNRNEKH